MGGDRGARTAGRTNGGTGRFGSRGAAGKCGFWREKYNNASESSGSKKRNSMDAHLDDKEEEVADTASSPMKPTEARPGQNMGRSGAHKRLDMSEDGGRAITPPPPPQYQTPSERKRMRG